MPFGQLSEFRDQQNSDIIPERRLRSRPLAKSLPRFSLTSE